MKLTKPKLIALLTVILLLSITISHFYPPASLFTIPLEMVLTTALISFTNHFSILVKSLLSYLFIGLNDIGVKIFYSGQHDLEAIGWIHTLLAIGLLPCFIMLIIAVIKEKGTAYWLKIFCILLFIALIYVHLELFETVGVPPDQLGIMGALIEIQKI